MVLRVLLVDDDCHSREHLEELLSGFPDVTVVGSASGGAEASVCLRQTEVDLVFLDIEMGDISGFDLARHIQTTYPGVKIVFLTGHVDFALDGYEYKPLDFLVKPVNTLRVERVLLRAREALEGRERRASASVRIGLPVNGGLEIIEVGNLLCLEKIGRQVYLLGKNGERWCSYESIRKLEDILVPYGFFRCHQSFLIQVRAIRSIHLDESKNSYNIQLAGIDAPIPLSRGKYPELKERLTRDGLTIF